MLFVLATWSFAFAAVSLDSIAVGATYRMTLTTGDVLEGVVDSKTDTSLVIDSKGGAFTFAVTLVTDYELLAPPPVKTPRLTTQQVENEQPITFDQLRQEPPGTSVRVTIKTGAAFTGTLVSVDKDNVRLGIDSSIIPIAAEVVDHIDLVPERKATPAAKAAPQSYDTLIVRNPQTDDYGKPMENLIVVGKIVKEDNLRITVQKPDNTQVSYTFYQVIRTFRHS